MKILLTIITILLLSTPSFAQDDAEKPEEAPAPATIDCDLLQKEIRVALRRPATCWTDEECRTVSWGCPWQFAPCHFSIYSTSEDEENKALSKKISQYDNICVNSDERMKASCDKFYQDVEEAQCKVSLELLCLSGKCSTPIDVILQGDVDAADIYGSREIIEE